ncbi:hypothetical protein ACX0HA_09695 [Flavobacterium hauense]
MAKLTADQIQFIDDRLYNLGVEFMDIRYEMVDHIASELEAKEGDFGDNWHEYFIMNRLQLLEQNKKAKRTAVSRAIKQYLDTLKTPMAFIPAGMVFAAAYFFAQFYMDGFDLGMYGSCILFILIVPFAIVSWKNKRISVMRVMVQFYSYIYLGNMAVTLTASFIENDAERMHPQRISISFMAALITVLIISLYRFRRKYVGKYI